MSTVSESAPTDRLTSFVDHLEEVDDDQDGEDVSVRLAKESPVLRTRSATPAARCRVTATTHVCRGHLDAVVGHVLRLVRVNTLPPSLCQLHLLLVVRSGLHGLASGSAMGPGGGESCGIGRCFGSGASGTRDCDRLYTCGCGALITRHRGVVGTLHLLIRISDERRRSWKHEGLWGGEEGQRLTEEG